MSGGRKLEFDKAQALENAMYTFWKKGYAGTSLSDLTKSMGINKPSLYSTFGNKEQLFVCAAGYYQEHYAEQYVQLLHTEGLTLRERLTNYITTICSLQYDPEKPKGCFISCCVSEGAGETIPQKALDVIEKSRLFYEDYLRQFFCQEIDKGHLSEKIYPEAAAFFIITLLHGTAAMARANKTFEEIKPVILLAVDSLDYRAVD